MLAVVRAGPNVPVPVRTIVAVEGVAESPRFEKLRTGSKLPPFPIVNQGPALPVVVNVVSFIVARRAEVIDSTAAAARLMHSTYAYEMAPLRVTPPEAACTVTIGKVPVVSVPATGPWKRTDTFEKLYVPAGIVQTCAVFVPSKKIVIGELPRAAAAVIRVDQTVKTFPPGVPLGWKTRVFAVPEAPVAPEAGPVGPRGPAGPVAPPEGPVGPSAPVGPVVPLVPLVPAVPVGPVGPAPVGPAAPVAPGAPPPEYSLTLIVPAGARKVFPLRLCTTNWTTVGTPMPSDGVEVVSVTDRVSDPATSCASPATSVEVVLPVPPMTMAVPLLKVEAALPVPIEVVFDVSPPDSVRPVPVISWIAGLMLSAVEPAMTKVASMMRCPVFFGVMIAAASTKLFEAVTT